MKYTGFQSAIRELERLEKQARIMTEEVAMSLADLIVQEARSRAPRDLGNLANAINREKKTNGSTVYVDPINGVPYGAFIEFGTGPAYNSGLVPEELKEEALKFKGYKGDPFDVLVAKLAEWCARKGLDPNLAYPIASNILNKGKEPKPYFWPAILNNREKLPSLIAEVLNRYGS